jgi:hypothetical protein
MHPPSRGRKHSTAAPNAVVTRLLMLFVVFTTCRAYQLCSSGWTYFYDWAGVEGSDSCFTMRSDLRTFQSAESACQDLGGHLLTSAQMNQNGNGLITALKNRYDKGEFWLGAERVGDMSGLGWGNWRWIDGTASQNLNCYSKVGVCVQVDKR